MHDNVKELRDKAIHYRDEAATALSEREREILLNIATESDRLAEQLLVLRKKTTE
jgi:hypothetical protein